MSDRKEEIRKKVDAIADGLIAGFNEHVKDLQAENPAFTDVRIIFEGWAIGKIAGLHGLVMEQAAQIAALEFANSKRR